MVKNQSKAVQFALLTVFLWSTVATAFKIALSHSPVVQVLIVATITSLLTLAFLFHRKNSVKSLLTAFKRKPFLYLISGLINPILYYFVLFAAYERLPAQIAQPINYTWAIVLSLLAAPVLGQKLRKGDGLGLLFCYLGVVILVTQLDFSKRFEFDQIGIILAIVSTIFWAVYWLINAANKEDSLTSIYLSFLCALPWALAILVHQWSVFTFDMTGLLASIYIGLFEMSISFVLWLKAMHYAKNTAQISSLVYLSPFVSLVFINQFLGEQIYPSTVLALLVICFGLLLQKKLGADR